MQTLIIIPTYNEKENVKELIKKIDELNLTNLNLLFVDDNSPDGTANLIKQFQAQRQDIHLLERTKKLGLGTAYIAGFKWGLKGGYEVMIEMDADLSHDPQYLPRMITEIEKYDYVIGSRYVAGGGVANWPWYRKLISLGGSLYARLILNCPIKDMTGGFTAWRREVLEAIDVETVRSAGYAFQVEMKYRAWKKGFKYFEMPIIFVDRRLGQSKISSNIFIEAMWRVLQIRFLKF